MISEEESKEVIEAVDKINNKIESKYLKCDNLDYMPELYYLKSPNFMAVEIMIPDCPSIGLWNSETTERIYYEKSDKYESMYKCLQRLFREYKEKINSVKF